MKILLLALLLASPVYAGNFNDNGVNMNTNTDANLYRANVSSAVGAHIYSVHRDSETSCPVAGDYELLAGTKAAACFGWFEDCAQSCVKYVDTEDRFFEVKGHINGRASNPNDLFSAAIFINGALQEDSHEKRYFTGTSDYGNLNATTSQVIPAGATIELKITNETAGNSFLVWHWELLVRSVQ